MTGCSHQCSYCYVRKYRELAEVPVLDEKDFPPLGKDRTIFVGHMTDMFCQAVRYEDIGTILMHCRKYPENEYVFQSKNTQRMVGFIDLMPERLVIGTTVETNRAQLLATLSKAPPPEERIGGLSRLKPSVRRFITVEPVLDFDVDEFTALIVSAHPDWINIGADSKGHGLQEPTREKILAFVDALQKAGVTIRKKINLSRIMGEQYGEEEGK